VTLFESEEQATTAPVGPSFRVRMRLAYDGTDFRGFALQKGVRTVAGDLIEATGKVLGQPIELTCAGRTDAGVHAWEQVVSFDVAGTPATVDLEGLRRSLNKMLGPAIAVRVAEPAPEGFDARRSATGRAYRYTVLNRPEPDPFRARTAWHVETPLDLRAMQLACDPLFGEHDFGAFCRRPPRRSGLQPGEEASLVRRVVDARWLDLGEGVLRFDIEASAFCHQMVRSIVGLLVAVGVGRRRAGEVAGILRSRDRAQAEQPAPPHGLCLWAVRYPDDSFSPVSEVPITP
jgi:tRNA pseudouridine38-40 synthase